ncbi:hypothetical protein [Amycolatopsis sp. SB7-3]|uniref:hypothetical protein n=1 Tax=Amycolatopsis sp. SB7-3 TaxID=3373438 RepID=UPI0037435FE3
MSTADSFHAFARVLVEDRLVVSELETILRRAHAVNIDFRGTARRQLRNRIRLLLRDIEREHRLLEGIDSHTAYDRERAEDLQTALGWRLSYARYGVFAFSRALDQARASDLDQQFELDIRLAVGQALDDCLPLVNELAGMFAQAPTEHALRSGQVRRSSWVSLRLVNLAVCALPWEERQRYLCEYASELHDLAQGGGHSKLGQVRYALRLLVRTPALTFALRASVSEASQRGIAVESGLSDLIVVQPDD